MVMRMHVRQCTSNWGLGGRLRRLMQRAEELSQLEPWDVALGSRVYTSVMLMHAQGRRTPLAHKYLLQALKQGIYISPSTLQVSFGPITCLSSSIEGRAWCHDLQGPA